jgi:hypothetical protein
MSFFACPSCSCHVRAGERACPHCDAPIQADPSGGVARTAGSVLLGLALGSVALGSGCGNEIEVVSGTGGASSSSHATTKSSSSSSKVSSSVSSSSFNVSSTYGVGPSSSTGPAPCADLPCTDQDTDPYDDCVSCSQTIGQCAFEGQTCSQNLECTALADCIAACPGDDPATMVNENLACICTSNDGTSCDVPSEPGTCIGDHNEGVDDYINVAYCVYGDGSADSGECGSACF